ncbi:MAG TPA: BlaI/MecI/CopY family transcriptional regulator [Gemmatimonadaceae bacterium]|nr:BlaI/MecI/CopY family transcriptional regulator [Gemmatimonadaceae bacterium]
MDVHLTDLQLAIVRVLWERGECTVAATQAALLPERPLAQTTVATILTRLEKRGVVAHRPNGRQFVYRALVTEGDVRISMVRELTQMLFGGSSAALINHVLHDRGVSEQEFGELRRIVAAAGERAERANAA